VKTPDEMADEVKYGYESHEDRLEWEAALRRLGKLEQGIRAFADELADDSEVDSRIPGRLRSMLERDNPTPGAPNA
jgi:hypothetical protein